MIHSYSYTLIVLLMIVLIALSNATLFSQSENLKITTKILFSKLPVSNTLFIFIIFRTFDM